MMRRPRWVMLQNRNSIVNALASADMAFTITAAYSGDGANMVNRREIIMNSGAPGGWPTSSL